MSSYYIPLKFSHSDEYYTQRQKNYEVYKLMVEVDKNPYTYVYGLVRDSDIIYIGVSDTPHKRCKHHIKHKQLTEVTLTLLAKGNRSDMLTVESILINKHSPILNKLGVT